MDENSLELPGPFVSAAWVAANRDAVLLADVRWSLDGSQGRHTHLERTIPGAVHVDLERVLAGPAGADGGRHPLPSPEVFARELGALGLAGGPVVAFDDGPGAIAARLVWLLRAIGEPAAVLDGGLAGWPGETAPGGAARPPVARRSRPWPKELLVDADQVAALAASEDGLVLDARAPERYAGEFEPIDPRPGHVPGARSAPFSDNLGTDGRLRPLAELQARYAALGVRDGVDVAVYCGSGVTACHDLLVLEALGHPGRLYPASWSGWSADPSRPAAVGPTPWGDGPASDRGIPPC